MIYLDYSANTPADPEVLETFLETERNFTGNPNSDHPAGAAARERLEETTNALAERLGVLPAEIIYTSGASEANNLAVKGSREPKDAADVISFPPLSSIRRSPARSPACRNRVTGSTSLKSDGTAR